MKHCKPLMRPRKRKLNSCGLTLIASLLFWCGPASAAECDGAKCAEPLAKGQKAPFDGQLLSPELAIELGLKAEQCGERIRAEKRRGEGLLGAEIQLRESLLRAEKEAWTTRQRIYEKALDEARPWYHEPVFVAIISVGATVAAMVGAGYVMGSVR